MAQSPNDILGQNCLSSMNQTFRRLSLLPFIISFQAIPFVFMYSSAPLLLPDGQVIEPRVLICSCIPKCWISPNDPSARGTAAWNSSSSSLFSYVQVPSSFQAKDIKWKKHFYWLKSAACSQ